MIMKKILLSITLACTFIVAGAQTELKQKIEYVAPQLIVRDSTKEADQ